MGCGFRMTGIYRWVRSVKKISVGSLGSADFRRAEELGAWWELSTFVVVARMVRQHKAE